MEAAIPEADAPRDGPGIARRSANERRILSLIQRHGPMAAADLARQAELSAQSASVITRGLEADGLLLRGEPVRGKVGKPLTPIGLDPDGVFSIGLRVGRRSADLVLMDFVGRLRGHLTLRFAFPTPRAVLDFSRDGIAELSAGLTPGQRGRLAGIGVGIPFELWKWLDDTPVPKSEMLGWKDVDFTTAFAEFTDLPVFVGNDGSMACIGEHTFGAARSLTDFAYFYVGAFVGGGIVLNNRLHVGPTGNAAAVGSIPMRQPDGSWRQLIASASLYKLEERIEAVAPGTALAFLKSPGWRGHDDLVEDWIARTVEALTAAAVTVVAVLDLPDIVIDGSLPPAIRERLADGVASAIAGFDTRGINPPRVHQGSLGPVSGALGSGYQPIVAAYLLD
ncbi:ROK family protein [Rhodobacterales bacterium HKCCE2091]|nr:ROK family protein [Rhodobacterales bacterium HKCCE2091]